MEGRLIEAARGRVTAALAARFRDLDLAEEAFAEAAASAVEAWRRDFPDDPPAWLWRTGLPQGARRGSPPGHPGEGATRRPAAGAHA